MGIFGLHLPKKVDEILGGVGRQINPFDNGATYSNPNPTPAPIQQPQQPNLVQRTWDRAVNQINPFDNGRTWQQPNPTNNRSLFGQLTHNAVTNVGGDFLAKPLVVNPLQNVIETGRAVTAEATGNVPALQASQQREMQNVRNSVPGMTANLLLKSGDVLRRTPQQIMTDIHGFQGKAPTPAELANQQAGLRSFQQTPMGMVASPAEKAFSQIVPESKPDLLAAGYNPNKGWASTGVDVGMGTLAGYGLAEAPGAIKNAAVDYVEQPKTLARNVATQSLLDEAAGRPPVEPTGRVTVSRPSILAPLNERGFVQVGRTPNAIHPDDAQIMAQFIDHARGITKLDDQSAYNLELDASRIAERYGITPKGGVNVNPVTKLANAFDDKLMKQDFGKQPKPTALTRVIDRAKNLTPLNEQGAIRIPGRSEPVTPETGGKVVVRNTGEGLKTQVLRGLSDRDQVILDQLKEIDKRDPVPKGQFTRVQRFMYDSNMQQASNSRANVEFTRSENVQRALGNMSRREARDFADYANARTELSTAGKDTKLSRPRAELEAIVKNGNEGHVQRFEALNQHYKELAKVWHDAGVISDKKYNSYVKNNDYIRLQRDMGDLVPSPYRGGSGYKLGSTTATQRRLGSTRSTLDPGQVALERTQQVYREAARNTTGTNLVKNLEEHDLARRVSANAAKNKNTVSIFEKGKKVNYEVSPEMKTAMDNINPYHMNAVMQILAAPGRTLRAGVTGLNPVFIARNLIKDQFTSAINSENMMATHNPVSFFKGLLNSSTDAAGLNKNPLYDEFLKHYGDQTSFDLTRNEKGNAAVVNRIRGGRKVGAVQVVAHPLRSLENLAAVTEKSTRYQNFVGEFKKATRQGLPKDAAMEKAAIAAWQNSVDFSRAGTWGRVINTVIPYWNPGTQGVRQMARTFSDHPVKSVFAGTALVGVPLATATAWNLSSPDTKKIYDNIPEYEKDNNLILVPPGTKQNQDGSYNVIKVPLPPGYKDVFMPIRRFAEGFMKDKPVQGAQIAQDILNAATGPINVQTKSQVAGSFVPQAVKPFVQQEANKDLFTGREIVPGYINDATDAQGNPIPESKKAFKNGSGTAQAIADKLHVSPIRVEKFIKDTAGTVGLNVLNAADNVFTPGKVGGQSVQAGFKRSFEQTQGIKNENATPGAKYYDRVKEVTQGLTGNELAAYNSLHPARKNFLGDQIYQNDATYDPVARLDIYNRFPKVYQADKAMDAKQRADGKPGNPLFDLENWQLKKVLEKENLPPGSKDPELSQLFDKEWYQNYRSEKANYFNKVRDLAAKEGKPFGASDNPYPDTPPALQKVMDTYNALPKGTGARSSWIKSNPAAWTAMQDQFAKIDNWQNVARGKRGLDFTEGDLGAAAGYDNGSSGGRYGFGNRQPKVYTAAEWIKKISAGSAPRSGQAKSSGRVTVSAKPRSSSSSGKVTVKSSKLRLA